jgi:PAS domain S-box-containing protein
MSESEIAKIKELEEKIRLLEIENADWTERAEDIFLFASTAESIGTIKNASDIYDSVLEKISIMKNIPYCALGTIGNGKMNIESEYASFTEDEKIAEIELSKELKEKALNKEIVIEKYDKKSSFINIVFKNHDFTPINFLIISFQNLRHHDGVLICIDSSEDDRFDSMRETLKHSVTLLNNRLDNLYLVEQLAEHNNLLEKRVAESLGELEEEIKEHVKTEEALRRSEKTYRTLFEKSNDAIFIADKNTGFYLKCNQAAERLTGLTEDSIKKLTVYDLIISDVASGLQEAKKDDNYVSFGEVEVKRNDGTIRTIVLNSVPLDSNSVFGIARDITEQKLAENELKSKEEHLRLITENAFDFIWTTNMEMGITYASDSVFRILGYTREEILKLNIGKLYAANEFKRLQAILTEELTKGNPHDGIIFSINHLRKDGSTIIAEINAKIIYDNNDNPIAIQGYTRDITAQVKAEEELVKSKQNAEKANKMKSVFLAQMSHEIRTPINTVVSTTSLLKYDLEETATNDQTQSFDIIERAGARIIRTVDLLLNLSEVQAGTYEPHVTKFDLYENVLLAIVADNKLVAKNKKIKLSIVNEVTCTSLVADLYTVNQIFIQIIENAIKYTEEGEVKITIKNYNKNKLVVCVKDTGVGISSDYLPKIFEPFSQEEMGYTRKFDGNGIGLALVQTYCKLNNAKIEVESEKNMGSTFRVFF